MVLLTSRPASTTVANRFKLARAAVSAAAVSERRELPLTL